MDNIYAFFDFITRLLSGDESVLDLLSNMVWGIVYIFVDGFLTIVQTIVSAIDLGSVVTSVTQQWGLLPPQLVYLINASGIPQCLSIIGWAYGIRFVLNLIPSTITRV